MNRVTRTTATIGALAVSASLLGIPPFAGTAAAIDRSTASDRSGTVANAEFRWGMNNESSNSGFAPGTTNFFSAGKLDNPGESRAITKPEWSATDGSVTIEKAGPRGAYAPATWEGLDSTPSGTSLGSPSEPTFSNHQVVIEGGTGTVDPARRYARIEWEGSYTVLYYSGMTFFYVSDPVLVVKGGMGTVTATLGGYATSRADTSVWESLPDKRVVIADLGRIRLDGPRGFTATPSYRGVRYPAPPSAPKQVRSGPAFGSFPRAFVDYQQRTGQGPYWYSSGGQTDAYKAALPLTVSYDAEKQKAQPEPAPEPGPTPEPEPTPPPAPEPQPAPDAETDAEEETSPAPASPAPSPAIVPPASSTLTAEPSPVAAQAPTPSESSDAPLWWLGGGLLAGALVLGALTFTRKTTLTRK